MHNYDDTGFSSPVFSSLVMLELAAGFFPAFAQNLILEPVYFCNTLDQTPTSEPAGKIAQFCSSITMLQIMGREKKPVRNGVTQHTRIQVRVILDMEDVYEKVNKGSALDWGGLFLGSGS